MLDSREFRELLIADVALVRGVAEARDVAAALQRFWEDRSLSLADELAHAARIDREALRPIGEEVDRLIEEAQGNAQVALTRRGGLDRSIHLALGNKGSQVSMALTEVGAGARAPLHTVDPERYANFEAAGEGGMGIVYMALDTEMNRDIAFKVVRPDAGSGRGQATPESPIQAQPPSRDTPASRAFEELKARFLQEAWVTGGLSHPGIVPVYEMGQTPTGVPYYTMKFVKGQRTLKDALDEVREGPVEDRLQLLEPYLKLCDTVAYAHSKGVSHRDLKPENVALGEFGEVVLLDWGLAKLEGREDLVASRWQERVQEFREVGSFRTAGMLGTPGYMSPEAALGRIDQVDAKSDVYSLGVMLYEILTGRLPYEFDTYAQYIDCVQHEDPKGAGELVDDVPEKLARLAARCLGRKRPGRPERVETVARAVRSWQAASAVEQEVEGHLRDARAALDAAEAAKGDARLRQVERAAGALSQAAEKQPESAALAPYGERLDVLREMGIRERERASGRRLLVRGGMSVLALSVVVAIIVIWLVDAERRRADRERDAKTEALAVSERGRREILRLSDAKRLRDLLYEAESYRLDEDGLVSATSRWLEEAEALHLRRVDHEASLQRLEQEARSSSAALRFPDAESAWQHDVLSSVLADLDVLGHRDSGVWVRVRRVHDFATRKQAALRGQAGTWRETLEAVALSKQYESLKLKPQAGLIPLGCSPSTGLQEFALAGSGTVPQRDVRAGELLVAPDFALVFVLMPGGGFWMGSQTTDPDKRNFCKVADSRESPVRGVALPPFFLAKYECTRAQWSRLSLQPLGRHEGQSGDVRVPVERVSWDDSRRTLWSAGLRLPSESEWEYACRAGTTTAWWTGEEEDSLRRAAWYEANSPNRAHPVGEKAANAFGLHDVHGNVSEWCEDLVDLLRGRQPTTSNPLLTTYDVNLRRVRGGNVSGAAHSLRSASRSFGFRSDASWGIGFRPARSITYEEDESVLDGDD